MLCLLQKNQPHRAFHFSDRQGQPISLNMFGLANPSQLTQSVTVDEIKLYFTYNLEAVAIALAKLSREKGVVYRSCQIFDLAGLSIGHMNMKFLNYFRATADVSQENYPECLGNVHVLNCPWIFQTIWKLVKPWFHPVVLEKIKIYPDDYKETLFKSIDPAYLPLSVGGTCQCKGGCIPLLNPEREDMTKIEVAARDKLEIPVDIEKLLLSLGDFKH